MGFDFLLVRDMSTSYLQKAVGDMLFLHLSHLKIQENARPDWLITPDGKRLELDFLIRDIDAAIEVQGQQHYVYIPYFHGSPAGFTEQCQNDSFKKSQCAKMGIVLYEVSGEYEAADVVVKLASTAGIDDIEHDSISHLPVYRFTEALTRTRHYRGKIQHLARQAQRARENGKRTGLYDERLAKWHKYYNRALSAATNWAIAIGDPAIRELVNVLKSC